MRWWAVFDHVEKNWKSNFVLDPILRFGQKSEPFLSHFELWKKGWSFKPATEKLNFEYLYFNNAILFFPFLVKRKVRAANFTSFKINWTSKMSSFWWRNLWSLLLPKKCDMRWWVAFDFDQVNWKNNFVLYLILSFKQLKFGLFLKQCELSKKDWNFYPAIQKCNFEYLCFYNIEVQYFEIPFLSYYIWKTTLLVKHK